jgi:hypothetical protein
MYSHDAGNVPDNVYQYSVYVPKDYDPDKSYPLVFFLHGGGKGRSQPSQGKWNMVSARLRDNNRTTDAGHSRKMPNSFGYLLVSPVKPVATWSATRFKRLYDHVKSKVSIDEDRIYVTGFSMGGQGTWHVSCGTDGSYNIAAMMPLGAWGCNRVRRGTTPETCKTTHTPVWVLHCPGDPVSKISEQLTLFQSHLDCGGYGRFTMIPGKRHTSRPPNDYEFFSMRMGWMLAQTYGTPFNHIVQIDGGQIAEVVSGDRPFTGDNNRYGFYEVGTTVNITASESENGKPFLKWASNKGSFADATSRSTSFTTPSEDVVVCAIYSDQPHKLSITGGTATPATPLPGQVVTVTADTDTETNKFFYWATNTKAVDLAVPTSRSFKFTMPSGNVVLNARLKESASR